MKRFLVILVSLLLLTPGMALAKVEADPRINEASIQIEDQNFKVPTVKFQDENYIKLRDLAAILKGNLKDFSIDYVDGEILIDTEKSYTGLKDDLKALKDIRGAKVSNMDIYVDGQKSNLKNINIKDYNYFRLRDLCELLDIEVFWDQDLKLISLKEKKEGDTLEVRRPISFRTTDDFKDFSQSKVESKVLENGDLQITYSVRVNTGGYSLSTAAVAVSDTTIYISPDIKGPGPNQMVTQVISYPTTSIIIAKEDVPKSYRIEIVGVETDLVDR